MPNDRRRNAKLRSLTLLFAAIRVLSAATLIVLGLRLLEQDKTIAAQHAIERRDAAADRAVKALELQLADLDGSLMPAVRRKA